MESMLIVTGTIAFDHILNFNGKFADYILPDEIHKINISFQTDGVKKEFGGTGGNQAYGLALLGAKPLLCTTVGNDFPEYRNYLKHAGVNVSFAEPIKDEPCAVGFAMTDKDDNQIWGFGQGAAAKIADYPLSHFLNKIKREIEIIGNTSSKISSSFVLLAPQNEDAMLAWAKDCRERKIPYLFDPAFQIPKMPAKKLKEAVVGAAIVIGNDYEIALINSKLKIQNPKSLARLQTDKTENRQIWIKTLGPEGSVIYDLKEEKEIKIKAAKPKKIADPTGAGDAYRAGFVAGYLRKLPPRVCGQIGSVSASFAIEKYGTINHSFSKQEFAERYESNYKQKFNL